MSIQPSDEPTLASMDPAYIDILYEDDDLVIVNKPANLLVHRSMIDRHETVFLMQLVRDKVGQHVHPLHRLDKPTSGVVIFAKSREFASIMQPVFEEHKIQKRYIAVLRGYSHSPMEIDYPLAEKLDKMTDKMQKDNPKREAITHLVPLANLEVPEPVGRYQTARFSLVSLSPITGRKHQLRRHMAHIRHPIIGDTTHGDGKQNAFARRTLSFQRLALHAYSVEFTHPLSQSVVKAQANFDDDFTALLSRFVSFNEQQEMSEDFLHLIKSIDTAKSAVNLTNEGNI